jgi:biopolymer transport protein ExbB
MKSVFSPSSSLTALKILRCAIFSALLASLSCRAAESFDEAMQRASTDYTKRLEKASEELSKTRERINEEKVPLLKAMRTAEDRIIAAETQTSHAEVSEEQYQDSRRRLLKEYDTLRKNLSYLETLAGDSLKGLRDGSLSPGEQTSKMEKLEEIQRLTEDSHEAPNSKAGVAMTEFLLEQLKDSLGGHRVAGKALVGEDKQVVDGTFIITGPETYFVAKQGGHAGTVRRHEGSKLPLVYPIRNWKSEDAEALAKGGLAPLPADSSSGKALKLMETQGTLWDHIQKGGVIAYAILGVGLVSLIMILMKIRDLSKMSVDEPRKIREFLGVLAVQGGEKARTALGSLGTSTREIFERGLDSITEPKEILEEHLYAVLLRQRLHFERRLPLLAVIATAAPLMGLLGTVMGMVKTFALITVFGTGNAGKLASGISEVLVATELGLMVAIPTLVAHGFLSHRIQKNLSLLERYALEFVSATETQRKSSAGENTATK